MTTITARKAAIRISIRRQTASMTRVTPPPSSGQMLASNDDSLHHCVAEDIVRMASRERLPEPSNPLGMDGIEFVEYSTNQPQAFGDLLQRMGFVPLARHRSREVMLYRQGPMNLIVNSHGATSGMPTVSAVALRVRDAAFAHKHSLDLGAWDMPTRASAMELNIPGIDRKSTRLNSSHLVISYAVFCLKKKRTITETGVRGICESHGRGHALAPPR